MRRNSKVGGQAVMEGVMMRSPQAVALAVRQPGGDIAVEVEAISQEKRPWYKRALFIRGVTNFIDTLLTGMKYLNRSAQLSGMDEEEPGKFEVWLTKKTGKSATDVAVVLGMVLGIGLAIGLFFILPQLIGGLVTPFVESKILLNLIEGGIRLVIFFIYLMLVSLMPDIKRLFAYHGAEHKTINAYEHGEVLTPENVMRHSTRHPRCGTSFLLTVMLISVLVFALAGWGDTWYIRVLSRLVLLPVVSGISYEVLFLLARWENPLTNLLRRPGMAVQGLTTREPDADMCAVAIAAFLPCLDEEERARCTPITAGEEVHDGAPGDDAGRAAAETARA